MDPLPAPQKSFKKDRSARKRRRSGGEQEGSESEFNFLINFPMCFPLSFNFRSINHEFLCP